MQGLLAIFVFSGLLATGAFLMCETCESSGKTCTGSKETCGAGKDTCATILSEAGEENQKNVSVVKSCFEKVNCNSGGISIVNGVNVTKTIQCSKAAPSAASVLLVVSGLLMKQLLL
ncbi:phospholipase A2 inhibitor and Ly6/PLAUR domain-containing protein-like [Varanus komodoensis]|uniref:phospholipase A2 inhibitor and Ly6/PLAUR domain-containing protein-like n=1 Tax=Varanus komodoensis TaxID=61221 RepID=UPI001CF790C1|nr:phospholipase A2 inhibitor and Ly6/PLAUR domain-containing protein-like [Varanus komodoensis]XP_044291103.1 phospholipase A2 inhibitor and Ly6/PLAUR domain-containing protein-like [Varanus komodoensis]